MQSFPELPFFVFSLEVFDDFKVPYAGGDLFKSDAPWPCLLMFSVLLDVFSQIYVGLSFPQSPIFVVYFFYPGALAAMRVGQKQISVISYHSVMVIP